MKKVYVKATMRVAEMELNTAVLMSTSNLRIGDDNIDSDNLLGAPEMGDDDLFRNDVNDKFPSFRPFN